MTESTHRDLIAESGADLLSLLVPVPGVGALARRLAAELFREQERRASVCLRRAEQLTGMTREELADAIAANPALFPMTIRVLHAAGQNGHDRILGMIGDALGRAVGAQTEPELQAEELLVLALESLRPEHIDLLALLSRRADSESGNWSMSVLRVVAPSGPEFLDVLLAGLLNTGLVATASGFGALIYEITPGGRAVLRAADEVTSA